MTIVKGIFGINTATLQFFLVKGQGGKKQITSIIYSTMMPEAESNKSSEILKSSKKKSSKNSTSQEELVVNDDVTFLPK